jgi:hypothetical protein
MEAFTKFFLNLDVILKFLNSEKPQQENINKAYYMWVASMQLLTVLSFK